MLLLLITVYFVIGYILTSVYNHVVMKRTPYRVYHSEDPFDMYALYQNIKRDPSHKWFVILD